MKKLLFTSIALAAMALGASAQTPISQFTFETSFSSIPTTAQTGPSTAGPLAAEVGNGSASGFHAGAATYSNTVAGNGSTHSFSSNGWAVGDYYQFSLSTGGSSNIFVTFGMTGSNTGPANFAFTFSTDGGATFTAPTNSAFSITNDSWSPTSAKMVSEKTFDLTTFTAVNNASTVIFRIADTSTIAISSANPVAAAGTARVDDFYVSTDAPLYPVPEPSTYAMIGGGLLTLLGVQRLRRRSC